ncbi:hypothetical protein BDV95DRAFT_643436 [Massariosphaeria phaeospora]|uniref:Uncharacterized protein n=1 Tax=Massariosphaeria phaeospora TaxID=100035 RepID=A0A7C8INZ5_9PLEO|nr:hypothetical protein BDV95DRAFT_643436 [Massariosphaeria phaeospora]
MEGFFSLPLAHRPRVVAPDVPAAATPPSQPEAQPQAASEPPRPSTPQGNPEPSRVEHDIREDVFDPTTPLHKDVCRLVVRDLYISEEQVERWIFTQFRYERFNDVCAQMTRLRKFSHELCSAMFGTQHQVDLVLGFAKKWEERYPNGPRLLDMGRDDREENIWPLAFTDEMALEILSPVKTCVDIEALMSNPTWHSMYRALFVRTAESIFWNAGVNDEPIDHDDLWVKLSHLPERDFPDRPQFNEIPVPAAPEAEIMEALGGLSLTGGGDVGSEDVEMTED